MPQLTQHVWVLIVSMDKQQRIRTATTTARMKQTVLTLQRGEAFGLNSDGVFHCAALVVLEYAGQRCW